ncbi:16S rRNA (uracil(1498)-N(3))-methyltransferase [Winogradskyella sp. A2]|uniref:16S rRNA (uracil(1498)-N(3))-methyltransferase n=1 Tax=Winogradskyella sp. A2 TaxID=3366944 RepID=UPI00398C8110
MQLFYNSNISQEDIFFNFDRDESRHIVKVLRKKEGDTLYITNGQGWIFEAQLVDANNKNSSVKIISKQFSEKRKFKLHLAVAPTKMNDRYEWFLEKATEIGVDTITPIICERSERKVIKTERFERIVQSAMKQSLQNYLPKLNAPIDFKAFIEKNTADQKFIAHCEDTERTDFKAVLETNKDCLILIGPEGDFSVKEIQMALQHDYIPVTLGETRLRTETAGVVACHTVALLNA